jgi:multidrug efflux pump subunit AcrB
VPPKPYGRWVERLLRITTVMILVYAGCVALGLGLFRKVPTGFIPARTWATYWS